VEEVTDGEDDVDFEEEEEELWEEDGLLEEEEEDDEEEDFAGEEEEDRAGVAQDTSIIEVAKAKASFEVFMPPY